jgi:pimeloyl-ACP methyl ester carboxylesterase
VILESGLGDSSSSWPLVIRHLSLFVRIYIHDRASLGRSKVNPLANNCKPEAYAGKAAEDLDKLLQKAGIDSLFILVPMSWGRIVAREFLKRRKDDDVVGMVMIECVQEKSTEIRSIDGPNTIALLKGLEFFEVVRVNKRQIYTGRMESLLNFSKPHAMLNHDAGTNARNSRKRPADSRGTLRIATH